VKEKKQKSNRINQTDECMKNKVTFIKILLLTAIGLFFVEKGFSQSGCTDCTITNPGGQDLTIKPGDIVCFTQNKTFGNLSISGGTICIAEGITVVISGNVNSTIGTTLNLELYGTLTFNQSTTMNATVFVNIYSKGALHSGSSGSNNFTFGGSGDNYINNYGLMDMGVLTFSNSGGNYYFENFGSMDINSNINIQSDTTKFKNNIGGTMTLGANFSMNSGASFFNCGTITITSGFNMGGGFIINSGTFELTGNINYGQGTSKIDNYGTINVHNGNIQMTTGASFYNEGVTTITGGTFSNDGHITGPESGLGKLGYIYFDRPAEMNGGSIGPNLNFKNTASGGISSFAVMFQNRTGIQRNEPLYWDCESTGNCVAPRQEIYNLCPDLDGNFPRYWTGSDSEDFNTPANWTTGVVPTSGEDVEFATAANNNNNPAVRDMRLPEATPITIGKLINETGLATIIPAGSSLTVNDEILGSESDASKLVIESAVDKPSGTLIFTNPAINDDVQATIQFYNQAYECKDCGFYRRSWQYFGIPVNESDFPYDDVMGTETVNQWVETYNGDKWQPAPYTPDTKLMAFKGYQITNNSNVQPEGLYSFTGTLRVGDASVPLTRTESVNYAGANLVGNSYTAAIPISATAMQFPTGVQQTLYLFNTGTRDQWRKLNGTAVNQDGYRSGQYLAVPVNLGGQSNFPDRIPSMHAFMLLAESGSGGNLSIDYSTLIKNEKVKLGDGTTEIVTRSAGGNRTATSASTIPSLVMDVIGEQSADRIWIFSKEGTTHGFDNGWDARKIGEAGIAQLYVMGTDESRLQVATVPSVDSILLGFEAEADGTYRLEYALSDHLEKTDIFLHDLATGAVERVTNGGSFSFEAKKGEATTRFLLTSTGSDMPFSADEMLIDVEADDDEMIVIRNGSRRALTVTVSNMKGELLHLTEVNAGSELVLKSAGQGVYVVRLQNALVNDVRRVIIK